MTLSDFRRITDELLSAYIDDEVTEQERALVEAALAQDEEIAWRLNSLRQTVTLLRDLPDLALPRSFALTLDHVAQANEPAVGVEAMSEEAMATPAAPPRLQRQVAPAPQTGFWEQVAEGWRRFWQGGNPMLRNAAAVSFALMLFLAGGGQLLNRALTQPAGMMATASEAPAAAPAASEAMPQTQSVAIAPTATEGAATEEAATQAESMQMEEDSSLKTPDEDAPTEETPTEESALIMQAPAESASESASDVPQETTEDAPEAASAARASSESVVAESEESAEGDAAVQAGEAAVAEAAPASDAPAPTATVEEPAVAAAIVAPEQPQGDEMPPLVANPVPGGGAGGRPQSGGGGGGMGGGGETGGLVPEEEHEFDVNPVGTPPSMPVAEAAAADVAVTPSVDEVAPEAAVEAAASSAPSESVPSEAAPSKTATPAATKQVAADIEPTAEPTPEAVALVAPGAITSTEIVENVEMEGTTPATGPAGNVPVVWVAQGSAFLLTIVLASLWWRSRTPRRPRRS